MGVVLSRYLIRHELGARRRFGWYFLDDYAEWLGQREEQIADILALSPEQTADGKLQLAVVVAEAKYIDAANLGPKRKELQKQLRDTIRRINAAIFGDPGRLDRDLWLSRFSDLMLNGIQFPANSPLTWRRGGGRCGTAIATSSCEDIRMSSCQGHAIRPSAQTSLLWQRLRSRIRKCTRARNCETSCGTTGLAVTRRPFDAR